MRFKTPFGVGVRATLQSRRGVVIRPRFKNVWEFECFDPNGKLKWRAGFSNIVVNVGLDEFLQRIWKSSAFTASDFIGLTDGTPTFAAADTMASHAGWVEVHTAYSEGTRQGITWGTVASQSVDNAAAKAVFSITATATVGGGFATDNSTKGGTAGILLGGGAFAEGDKAVDNGDTLNVQITSTAATA